MYRSSWRKQGANFLPPKGQRSRGRGKPIAVAIGAGILIAGVIAAMQINQYFFASPPEGTTAVEFTVSEGESVKTIAKHLEEQGIIKSAFWFRMTAKFSGLDNNIRAGKTTVEPGDRYADVLGALIYPAADNEVSITIPEGFTLGQIDEAVRAKLPDITADEWARVTGPSSPFASDPFVVAAQKPADADLEGYLFPDTYRFFKDATAEDVVEILLNTMKSRVETLGPATGDATNMTTHELLTLSSTIEREVRGAEDMRIVSDIFLKRLSIGMALQSDATVNYVTGGDDPSISNAERETESPYNTYMYPGLPPGPISNPGLNALKAVWNPDENDYYYFLTDAEGKVYYARTNDEHVINKQNHLQ